MLDALIVCTRNRAFDLKRCLESVSSLHEKPDSTIVVDSSNNSESHDLVNAFVKINSIPNLKYVRSEEKGLTVARNVGIEYAGQDFEILHFVDDDVELKPDYIKEIREAFQRNVHLVGAGGKVLGSGYSGHSKLKSALWLDSPVLGKVTWSGINIGSYDSNKNLEMDWLPGCSMSFRTSKIKGLFFDPMRNVFPLGEDVDFGLRASARGTLAHVPKAELFHHLSPQNRDDEISMIFQDILHRFTMAEDGLGRVKKSGVVLSTINLGFLYLIASALGRSKPNLEKSVIVFKSLWTVLSKGGLRTCVKPYSR